MSLRGRAGKCALLDGLISSTRHGESRSLVALEIVFGLSAGAPLGRFLIGLAVATAWVAVVLALLAAGPLRRRTYAR